MVAAVIVTLMLIPQSLAYALLAGLPAEVGLYASIAPLLLYAIFGTSRVLAIGPVAIVSLMTAEAISKVAPLGTTEYWSAAFTLAFLSGIFLMALGALRAGFLANFLSHPVISGFISAAGILIATSQVKYILGLEVSGNNFISLISATVSDLMNTNIPTLSIGVSSLVFLYLVRVQLQSVLETVGMPQRSAILLTKTAPIVAIVVTTGVTIFANLAAVGVATVGSVPQGLPPFTLPAFDKELWLNLSRSAVLISVIGFVESVSVSQTLAAKRRERIDPNQELIGLGTANVAAGLTGGYPVTGGFARSVVNFDAGARTPAAGALTAMGIALVALFLTPALYYLPKATLAATIIVAVLSLVDIPAFFKTWRYSKSDFIAMAATLLGTLMFGIESGVLTGVVLSLLLFLYRTSRPHCAVVGQVPGTEHFRNIHRHAVLTNPHIITLRVDESLYFANARFLEDKIFELITANSEAKHVILMCSAINAIDASALESMEAINLRLKDAGVCFHLSEVKGPVMDKLKLTSFLDDLTGEVFLSQFKAVQQIEAELNVHTLVISDPSQYD